MKSALEASFLACILAFTAACSSADDGADAATSTPEPATQEPEAALLSQSLVAPNRPPATINPCAAVLCPAPSTCDVVDGQAVCTPIEEPEVDACAAVRCRAGTHCEVLRDRARCVQDEPVNPCAAVSCLAPSTCEVVNGEAVCTPIEEPPPASGPFCGGIAAFPCPGQASCVDNPNDGCDPDRGGADCGGVCECNVRALCIQGFAFDASPEVCACVPTEPEVDACAAVRCRAGTHCEVVRDRARCVQDEPEPVNPCAAVSCLAPSTCEVVNGEAVCTPIEEPPPASGLFCGGIAAFPCPGSGSCVDNPSDDCDPDRGGADCGGICECNIRALCIQGFTFDPSPEVCACVPDSGGSGQECSAD